MYNEKSDFRKFCETMWVVTKYDVLPWVAGVALCAGIAYGLYDLKKNSKDSLGATEKISLFQKQR